MICLENLSNSKYLDNGNYLNIASGGKASGKNVEVENLFIFPFHHHTSTSSLLILSPRVLSVSVQRAL